MQQHSHEGIIPRETFNRVQAEFERRKSLHATGGTIFSGRIYCGQCGQIYGSKVWHSTDKHRRIVWHCNDKFNGDSKCETPTLTEDSIKTAFERILRKLAFDRTEMIHNLQEVQQEIGEVSELEREKVRLQDDRDAISDMLQQAIRQNASVALDQEEYNDRYDKLAKEDADLVTEIARLDRAIVEKHRNGDRIRLFIHGLASIRSWWYTMGIERYPHAPQLLITADGGGSNGSRNRLWKTELQALANEIGLKISVCHFPPGTSKWNKIEHRMFSQISQNWRGRPLESLAVIVNLIASTTTKTGLTIQCQLDLNQYPKGIKVSDDELASVNIVGDEFHPNWNYTILPQTTY